MPHSDRRLREHESRRQLIVSAATQLAEANGWAAVTTRRLAEEIEFSQPVLYSHFANKKAIVGAVAGEGFGRLRELIAETRTELDARRRFSAAANSYLEFARAHPAVYEAMFAAPSDVEFASEATPETARAAFDGFRRVVVDALHPDDPDTMTELVWSSLHGLAALQASHRLRDGHQKQRVEALVRQFTVAGAE